jgi:NTP pyrophosphatase (non-canonical NTP hydrolase)
MGNAVADNADERYLRLAEEFAELMAACQAPLTTIISVIQAVYSKEAKKDSSEVGKISEECADVLICLSALATTHEVDLQEETHRILTRNWDNIDKIRAKHKNKKFKSAALIKDTTNGE